MSVISLLWRQTGRSGSPGLQRQGLFYKNNNKLLWLILLFKFSVLVVSPVSTFGFSSSHSDCHSVLQSHLKPLSVLICLCATARFSAKHLFAQTSNILARFQYKWLAWSSLCRSDWSQTWRSTHSASGVLGLRYVPPSLSDRFYCKGMLSLIECPFYICWGDSSILRGSESHWLIYFWTIMSSPGWVTQDPGPWSS